ncbi:hypothetical protein NCU16641 [Neurospora crassa OR74A]|uniref:Uncharacterized protein n=1 Tax=Neurospora crassa (strain ATCC 24698 / 74-OR23-1A / CBS 708.71 / DSM 1257 / FGSC 987) TaxID=367110 RepID=U9W304_NEUCR|nr:hypothetical protein NCU16641 [Neurospora crassa OR74A]ESA43187.1 hypothetical protein NCU16641 [Neurospora crassa OR74A]|eukprot:XP_011394031.1 hypothetical protein NCU16641 [Neurospora crassa OR74A]
MVTQKALYETKMLDGKKETRRFCAVKADGCKEKRKTERGRETGTRVVGKTQEYGWRRQTHTQAHTDTYTWITFTHELDGHRARIESSLGSSTSTSTSTFTYFRALDLLKF